jgi:hypothetical protein
MLKDIADVRPLGGYRLQLRFEDGVEGMLDISDVVPFDGIFAWLRDTANFSRVALDRELGTIVWPNGADLDADVLYAAVLRQQSQTVEGSRAT